MLSKYYWESALKEKAKSLRMSLKDFMERDRDNVYRETRITKHAEWDILWEVRQKK